MSSFDEAEGLRKVAVEANASDVVVFGCCKRWLLTGQRQDTAPTLFVNKGKAVFPLEKLDILLFQELALDLGGEPSAVGLPTRHGARGRTTSGKEGWEG